jgi:hypothetical protein
MNRLEEALIDAAETAHEDYMSATGGWWLSSGPESFIQYAIAIKLREQGFLVYPEASPGQIMKEWKNPPKGPPPKNIGPRFDLVIREKTTDNIRAIIEIKQAWQGILHEEREKIAAFIKQNDYVKSGYLLLYAEAKGEGREDILFNRLKEWANDLKCELVGSITDAQGDGEWGWTTGLFRLL